MNSRLVTLSVDPSDMTLEISPIHSLCASLSSNDFPGTSSLNLDLSGCAFVTVSQMAAVAVLGKV